MLHRKKRSALSGPVFEGGGRSGPSDTGLMRAMKAGDASALERLMDRYWLPLVRFSARSASGWDEAEDMAQDVFVRLWQAREQWEPGGSVRTFLYRSARNLAVDRARHREVQARSVLPLERGVRRTATPVENVIRGELQDDFERALSDMAPRRREAFVLVRLQGLSLREAGEVMELMPRTIANHVYLAATELAEALRRHIS